MTVTADDLAQHLGFAATPDDTETLGRALASARAVITPYLIVETLTPDQSEILDLATLTAAQTFWRLKDSTGGTFVFAEGTDQVGVLPRDVLGSVHPMLAEAGLVAVITV